jgi:tetratricopeptide (TPR) repeat protein
MSYINDALRKAQGQRDSRYERFGEIIAPCPAGRDQPRKRRLAIGAAITLFVLISAGLLATFTVLHRPPPVKKGPPAPVAAGPPATLQPPARQAAGATAAGQATAAVTAPAGAQAEVKKEATPVLREAELRYKEALSAQRMGDHKGAEALYRKVLALDPGHVRTMNNLGVIFLAQKKREQAIALFSKAIVLKRDYVDPYYNLACLYAQANEIDESLWYLKVAMAIDGDVKNWVMKDDDMKNVAASPGFKKIMEGQKN